MKIILGRHEFMSLIDAFLLDFVTVDFDQDSKVAERILQEFQTNGGSNQGEGNFLLDTPVASAGWYFAKLFLSAQFVRSVYELNTDQIANSKGKKFEEKFVTWLNTEFKRKKCGAHIKIASEMK